MYKGALLWIMLENTYMLPCILLSSCFLFFPKSVKMTYLCLKTIWKFISVMNQLS